jgi:hypothetical protein
VDKVPISPFFLLVHGTWARGAQWTKPGSALCGRLLKSFPDATMDRLEWGGANSFQARLEAADRLRRRVQELRAKSSDAAVFLKTEPPVHLIVEQPAIRSYVQLDIEPSFKHQRVVDCILQIPFRPLVPFRRQDRLMPQQKLNLFQFPALRAA